MDETNPTRQRLLDTALEAFSRKGYDGVGIQEIVQAAGVTKPTLYYHCESKLGLLAALLEEGGAELVRIVANGCRYEHDLTANLNRLAQGMFAFSLAEPAFTRLLLALTWHPLESESHAVVRAFQTRLYAALAALFLAAEHDHGNMLGRSSQYATSFLGLLQTYAGMLLDGHLKLTDDLAYRVVHQFMHGIFS
jgi:TetR/AcrR family transcriptional regulator